MMERARLCLATTPSIITYPSSTNRSLSWPEVISHSSFAANVMQPIIKRDSNKYSKNRRRVSFADAMGGTLTYVKLFEGTKAEECESRLAAIQDIHQHHFVQQQQQPLHVKRKTLVPKFSLPIPNSPAFWAKLNALNITLDSFQVQEGDLSIHGVAVVKNLDFHKSVYVRYTKDNWSTIKEIQAKYVSAAADGTNLFEFRISGVSAAAAAAEMHVGSQISVALRLHCAGNMFWDNNANENYIFECQVANDGKT